jgi:hypothetical protein
MFADALTELLAARTQRPVPGLVLAPGATLQGWRGPAPARGNAWAMAPGYPEPGQVTVAVGHPDGTVAVWQAASGNEPRTVLRLDGIVTAVATAGDATLAGSVRGEVSWVPGPGAQPVRLPSHPGRVSAVAAGPRMLVSLDGDGRLHRIRLGGRPDLSAPDIVELGSSGAAVLAAAERAPVAVAGGTDGILRVLDLEHLDHRDIRLGVGITALALDPGGELAVIGHNDGSIVSVRLADGESRRLFAVPRPPAGPLAVSLAADASVVAADAAGLLTAWSGRLFGDGTTTRLGRHSGGVGAVRHLAPAGVLAVGQRDGVLQAWPLPDRPDQRTTGEVR